MVDESYDEQYLLQKQLSHEFHSPEYTAFSDSFRKIMVEQEKQHVEDLKKQGKSPEVAGSTVEAGVEEPAIDPVSAAAGGFVGPLKVGLSQGLKLLPSLSRASVSGTVAAAAEYPIGVATGVVEERFPRLALPFTVAVGFLSGATVEKYIEKAIIKRLPGATKQAIKKEAVQVTQKLKSGVYDETTAGVTKTLNKAIGDLNIEDVSGGGRDVVSVAVKSGGQSAGGVSHIKAIENLPDDIQNKIRTGELEAKKGFMVVEKGDAIGENAKFMTRMEVQKQLGLSTKEDIDAADLIGQTIKDKVESRYLKLESDIKNKKYAANINLERIESVDDIKHQINKTADLFAPGIKKARRDVITNEQTSLMADALGMTPEQLLKRQKGEAFSAEYALASRRLLVSSADNLSNLAKKVESLDATDIDKYEFKKALNTHYAIQAQVSGMTAEAGRALQSFNIPAGSSKIKVAQIKDFLENVQGLSVEDLARGISTMDSVRGINTFVRQAQNATTVDMVLEAWINGLLSGPQTHAVNTLSNTLTAIWQIPERYLAAGISKLFRDDAIGSGEATKQMFGLVQGAKDGFKAFAKTVVSGESSDVLGKIEARFPKAITAQNIKQLPLINKLSPNALEEGGVSARFVDFLGEGVRVPGRLLTAEDDFFKSIGYRMELNARAYRRAVTEEGLKGQTAGLRMQEIINDPQKLAPDIHLASVNAARYQTFTKPLGEGGKAIQTFLNQHPFGRVIVPFVRTPTNILKFAGERTPLAIASRNVRGEIAAGGARRDLALAKLAVGSMGMATVAGLTMEGKITGNGPTNSDMRAIKYNTGWKPYSVKIGDKYYSYNRLEPIGMLFGIAADFAEIAGGLTEDERNDMATAIVGAVSQNITSKTWLRGLSEAISAIEDPQRYGAKWFENLAGTVVPTGVAQVERVLSPEMSAVYSAMDAIKARVPGYSDTLPPRRNIWAEVIAPEGGLGPDIISPIYTSTVKLAPVDRELLNLKLPLKMPQQTQIFEGIPIKLTALEYDRFLVLMNEIRLDSTGKVLKQSLSNMIASNEYRETKDPDMKEMRIRDMMTEARFTAKEYLKLEFPILKQIMAQELLNKEQLQ